MIQYLRFSVWPILFIGGLFVLIACTPEGDTTSESSADTTTTDTTTTDTTTTDTTTTVVPIQLTVTTPNGGESWGQESTYTITWNKVGGANYVKIELYKADKLSISIESDTENDGSYSWEIPSTVLVGSDYKIRIQSIKPDSSQSDLSDQELSIRTRHVELSSPAFTDRQTIPKKYTCDGADSSPPLTISGIPDGTKELVLFLDDLDGTPTATKGDTTKQWNHWVVYKIPVVSSIAAGSLPSGAQVGRNDFNDDVYRGPCPPVEGESRVEHNYRFRLYAIDTNLSIGKGATKSEIVDLIEGHVLQGFTLNGRYWYPGA